MTGPSDPNAFPALMSAVFDSIYDTMTEGEKQHTPGTWITEGHDHHIRHGAAHIARYIELGDPEDLEHGLCRLGMAVWSRKNGHNEPDDGG